MKTKQEIRDEVIALHPYRIVGRPETYDTYNQGWEDACYAMEDKLQIYSDQENHLLIMEIEELKEMEAASNFIIADLRRRLSECEGAIKDMRH